MTLHLRGGTTLPTAATVLRQQAEEGRSFANSPSTGSPRIQVHHYLNWVESTEAQLRNVFTGADVLTHLRSSAHWEIIRVHDAFLARLLARETRDQAEWLDSLVSRLDRLHERLTEAPGAIAVVDTNVLLHYQRPSGVNWTDVVGQTQVRLVLPLRVVEEMDEKKWLANRNDVRARAQGVLSGLWRLLEPTGGGPARLRDNVTVEVPIDDEPRRRTLDADEEILETCEQVRNVGQPVCLVTGDTGMSIRGVERGLRVAPMPEMYRRKRPQPESAEADEEKAGI